MGCKPQGKTFARLAGEFVGLRLERSFGVGRIGTGKARQDRVAGSRIIGAAPCDLDGGIDRLRQVGEERGHLGLCLQVVIRGETPAFVHRDDGPIGDRQKRVMRLVVVGLGEEGLVSGDQR